MHLPALNLAAVFCLAATVAQAAGLKFIDMPADAHGPALAGAAWYPCAAPAKEVRLRSIVVPALEDCPVAGEKLPLIVVSHGTVGWFGGHHDTAATLADAGFVVAAISHPGDTVSDPSRVADLSILFERPAAMKRLVDSMTGTWPDRADRRREDRFFRLFERRLYRAGCRRRHSRSAQGSRFVPGWLRASGVRQTAQQRKPGRPSSP
jgi:predicted dienelactone hydrolase